MNRGERSSRESHRALSAWTRVRLLDRLREAGRPLAAAELAEALQLRVSTIRFHLDILARAGLVESCTESERRRGRPRRLWSPGASPAVGADGPYRVLAEALARYLDEREGSPEELGEAIGRPWGASLVRARGAKIEEGLEPLLRTLEEMGFSPEQRRSQETVQIRLHSCPFLPVARQTPRLICSAHLGLLRGALQELRLPLAATRLEALVEPSLCVAHLRRVAALGAG